MASSKGKSPILKIKAQISATKADVKGLNSQIKQLAAQLDPIKLKVIFDGKASKNAAANLQKIMQKLQSEMSSFNKNFGAFGSGGSQGLSAMSAEAKAATDAINGLTAAVSNLNKQKAVTKKSQGTQNVVRSVEIAEGKVTDLDRRFSKFENSNPLFLEKYGSEVEKLKNEINDLYLRFAEKPKVDWSTEDVQKANEEYTRLNTRLKAFQHQADKTGLAGDTLGGRIKKAIEKFGGWTLVTKAMMGTWRQFKQMYQNVKNLNLAMTELKKVTSETDAEYERFLTRATARAKELGATLVDTVQATADYARLGYSIEQAESLADASLVYKHVGDGLKDITEASESIISTMKAFNVEASDAMSIVDRYNEIGNKFAISSSGVGAAMQKSASALAYANNTLDESIALVVAANATVQDPEVVGTALKTLSMRLRSSTAELEEAGLETEGMAETTATLRKELLALAGVDIMLDENTLKSTYQIMTELAAVWDKMTDVESAAVLELVAGKRMANTAASIIQNIEDAGKAYEVSQNAAGSAMAENEKYLESIQGHMDQLSATYESLSQNLIDSDTIKLGIDLLTELLNLLDNGANAIGEWPVLIFAATSAIKLLAKEGSGVSKALQFVRLSENPETGKRRPDFVGYWKDLFAGGNTTVNLTGVDHAFSKLKAFAGIRSLGELADDAKNILSDFDPKVLEYFNAKLEECNGDITKLNPNVDELQEGLEKTQKKSKLAELGVGLLNTALVAFASWAIQEVIKAIDDYIHRVDIAKEESRDFFNEFESGKEELEGIVKRLDEISDKITELNSKGKLSLVEQEELKDLREESAELERQKRLQEQINSNNERLAKERAAWAYENDRVTASGNQVITSPITAEGAKRGQYGVMASIASPEIISVPIVAGMSRADYLASLAETEKDIMARLAEAEENHASAATAAEKLKYKDEINKINEELSEHTAAVNATMTDLQSTLEIVGSDSDIGKEIIHSMGKYFNEIDPTYAIGTFVDKVAQSTERDKVEDFMNRLKSGEISERGAVGALKRIAPKLISDLQAAGVSAEEVVEILNGADTTSLVRALDEAALEAQIYTNQELAESFSNVASKVDELGKAYWEQANNGNISLATLQNLMANHDNWMDMITVENGLIKLNGEVATLTAKEYIQAEINKLKASLATMEAIKASTEKLKKQALTLGSMSASAILAQEALDSSDYERTAAAIGALEALLDSTANGFNHLSEATDAAAKAQEEYNDALKRQGEAAIKAIDKKIEAKQKELEQLEEEYEAEDKLFELQKARDRYEAAKKNLNTRLYTEDKGWVWVADPTELKDSQEELEKLEKEQAREAAKKAIEDEIEALEDLKDKYQEAMDQIGMDLQEHADMLEWLEQFEEMTYDELAAHVEAYADKVVAEYERIKQAKIDAANAVPDTSYTGDPQKTYTPDSTPSNETFGALMVPGSKVPEGTWGKPKTKTIMVHGAEITVPIDQDTSNAFASGTRHAPRSGIAIVDEIGPELIARHNEAGRLTHLELGDTVFPADMTQRLWDLAATGVFALASASRIPVRTNLHEGAFAAQQPVSSSNDIVLTGCRFELNNVTDVDSFFGELNRIANRHKRK